jgi:hypothetical protein
MRVFDALGNLYGTKKQAARTAMALSQGQTTADAGLWQQSEGDSRTATGARRALTTQRCRLRVCLECHPGMATLCRP